MDATIIKSQNINTIVIQDEEIVNFKGHISIIMYNHISMYFYKNIILDMILSLPQINIKFFNLKKTYNLNSDSFNQRYFNGWEDDHLDHNEIFKLILNTEKNILIFRHDNIKFDISQYSDKHIIECEFINDDFGNNNSYNLYYNGTLINKFEGHQHLYPEIFKYYDYYLKLELNDNNEFVLINDLSLYKVHVDDKSYIAISSFLIKDSYKLIVNSKEHNIIENKVNLLDDVDRIKLYGFNNYLLLNETNKEKQVKLINEISTIIKTFTTTDTTRFIYEMILSRYSELLNLSKNEIIEKTVINDKSDKFNLIELLTKFAKGEQFIFNKINCQIKQNKNIIQNLKTINECNNNINKWSIKYNDDFLNNIDSNILDNNLKNSLDIYSLIISRTSWLDEVKFGNVFGIITHLICPKLSKLGLNMSQVEIISLSNNFMTFEQICETQDIFNGDHHKYDDGRSDILSITGNALGEGNSMLPLYINKIHWSLVQTQLNYVLGVMINQNPFNYYNKFYEIYPMCLLKYCEMMISNKNKITDKDIIIFLQLLITTNMIFRDFYRYKFNKKDISSYVELLNDPLNRTESELDNIQFIMGVTILSNNKILNDLNNKFRNQSINLHIENIRRSLKKFNIDHNILTKFDFNYEYLYEAFTKNKIYDNANDDDEYYHDIYKELIFNKLLTVINNDTLLDTEILENMFINQIYSLYDNIDETIDNKFKPISTTICWDLINQLNNNNTIKYINKILDDPWSNIDDETIKYFKNNLLDLNNKYEQIYGNKQLYFKDQTKIRKLSFYFQCTMSRNKENISKYFNVNLFTCELDEVKKYLQNYIKNQINKIYRQDISQKDYLQDVFKFLNKNKEIIDYNDFINCIKQNCLLHDDKDIILAEIDKNIDIYFK